MHPQKYSGPFLLAIKRMTSDSPFSGVGHWSCFSCWLCCQPLPRSTGFPLVFGRFWDIWSMVIVFVTFGTVHIPLAKRNGSSSHHMFFFSWVFVVMLCYVTIDQKHIEIKLPHRPRRDRRIDNSKLTKFELLRQNQVCTIPFGVDFLWKIS